MKRLGLLCGLLVLLCAMCSQGAAQPQSNAPPNKQNTVYENQYLRIVLPPGWTARATRHTPAAVNISKGDFILYINTQASQASGVEGGRFAEIAMGAPSSDAVVTEYPSPPCGNAESKPARGGHTRIDLYVNKADAASQAWCNAPASGATVWYFSYLTDAAGGFFNFYVPGENRALVVTMAYRSKDVNRLPVKGSPELDAMLAEMTAIVDSLKVKQK